MIKKILLLAVLGLTLTLSSCQIIQDWIEDWVVEELKELAEFDQKPPPGYDPNFIQKVEDIKTADMQDVDIEISRIDASDPNKVKMYVHLIKDDEIFLKGASSNQFADIWCMVYDTTGNGNYKSEELVVTELNESDVPPLSTAIVMDLSGSMGDSRAKKMQAGVKEFIEGKASYDRIGLVRYDTKIDKQLYPTSDLGQLMNTHKVEGLKGFGGGTETLKAIDGGLDIIVGEDSERYKSVIVFTDGVSTYEDSKMKEISKRANDNDVVIHTIDYGYNVVEGKLRQIADNTSGIYHHIYSQDEFKPLFKDLYNRMTYSYVIEYTPSDYGIHQVGIQLCLRDTVLIASAEFDNTPKEGSIALLDVNFDTNKSILKEDQEPQLRNLLSLMKLKPTIKIELQGHTDDRGDDELNQKLSQDRADAVRAYLTKNGISANRITAKGFGETTPIATNDTEAGRAKNRRTQFKVVER